MTEITITTNDGKTKVSSPYHRDFPARARRLGGRWDGTAKVWTFDARDLERVRELCREIYGTDGEPETAGELVTLRVTWAESDTAGRSDQGERTCYVAGREVARAYSRDGGAKLAEGVVVLEGGFYSCGSMKYPELGVKAGTVVEIRDVPAGAPLEADLGGVVEVLERGELDRAALEAERARLVARLAEIDAALASG